MDKIIDFIKDIGTSTLISILTKLLNVVDKVFIHLENKDIKKENKEIDKSNKELKDICDKGTLDDLVNLTKKSLMILITLSILISGCKSDQIDVLTTKSWEGHYYTVEDFKTKTNDIKLDKKESIWVLSNQSLYYILKQQKKDTK